jgi:hypothetical protein
MCSSAAVDDDNVILGFALELKDVLRHMFACFGQGCGDVNFGNIDVVGCGGVIFGNIDVVGCGDVIVGNIDVAREWAG